MQVVLRAPQALLGNRRPGEDELWSTWRLSELEAWVEAGGASSAPPPTLFAFVYFLSPAVSESACGLEDRDAGKLRRVAAAKL